MLEVWEVLFPQDLARSKRDENSGHAEKLPGDVSLMECEDKITIGR